MIINKFILKEGNKKLFTSLAITLFSYFFICDILALLFLLATIFIAFIYRNNLKEKAKVTKIIAPIDGKILAIDKIDNKSVIHLEVNLCDSHILVAPKDSSYKFVSSKNGLNLKTNSYKAKILNEKKILSFDDIFVELISGKCNFTHDFLDNSKVHQYQKIGLFFDGLIKITIPNNYPLSVKLGQKIKTGEIL